MDSGPFGGYPERMLAPPPLPRTLEACFRDVASQRPEVRAEACEELGRHLAAMDEGAERGGSPERGERAERGDRHDERDGRPYARGVEALAHALRDDHPGVRGRAATALADARATTALASLLVAVEDPDGYVRQMALSALGELGDPRAGSKLRRALTDSRPEVRYQAVIAFSRVCPDDAEEALVRAFADDDDAVRHIALRVVEERLEKTPPAARGPGSRAGEAAVKLLGDAHPDVRVAAAILVSRLGDPRGHPRLLEVARGGVRGVSTEEEHGALEACGELGLTAAIPALERRAYGLARLVSDTGALSAKVALAALGHERAVSELLGDLSSSKASRRDKAIMAAGRARLRAAIPALEALAERDATRTLAREALERLR